MGYKEILDELKKIQKESKKFYKSRTGFKEIMKQCDTPSGYSRAKNLLNTCDTDTLERLSRDFRASVKNSETSDSLFINFSLAIVSLFLVLLVAISVSTVAAADDAAAADAEPISADIDEVALTAEDEGANVGETTGTTIEVTEETPEAIQSAII